MCKRCSFMCFCCVRQGRQIECEHCDEYSRFKRMEHIQFCPMTGNKFVKNERCKK